MAEDHLIAGLEALCKRFAQSALEGRYEVATRAGLSEQYLYQILARKPMANGSSRSLGKKARAKITKAFPDWLEHVHSADTSGTGATSSLLSLSTIVELLDDMTTGDIKRLKAAVDYAHTMRELEASDPPRPKGTPGRRKSPAKAGA